jgi:hypothetical protein
MTARVASAPSSAPAEVWLRGNVRPVLAMGAPVVAVAAALLAIVVVGVASPTARWIAGGAAGALLVIVAMLAWTARRPRLIRLGDRLLVRTSPTAVADVPLDVVECFFPGSNPIDAAGKPTCGEQAAFRVGTLVLRIAEQAAGYQSRDSFRPWVVWEDGAIVIDGRWCEPLSPGLARDLGGRLMEAKRGLAAAREP